MPCRYNQWFSVALEAYRDYFCSFRGIKRSFKLFKDQDTEFLSQLVERKYEPCDREYERGQIKSPTQHLVEGIDNLNPCAIDIKSKDEKGFGFNSVLTIVKMNFDLYWIHWILVKNNIKFSFASIWQTSSR